MLERFYDFQSQPNVLKILVCCVHETNQDCEAHYIHTELY